MNYYLFGSTLFTVVGDAAADERTSKFRVAADPLQARARFRHTIRLSEARGESEFTPPENAVKTDRGCMCFRENGRLVRTYSSDELRYRAETSFDGYSGETVFTSDEKTLGRITVSTLLADCGIVGILLRRGGILLHSSYIIAPNGKALLFSGPSGIGKSTQAENWKNAFGSATVNGDRTLIEPADCTANGIFYCGTSGICENVTSDIAAIVVLTQADGNRAERMKTGGAFRALLSQCALDRYDKTQIEDAVTLVSDTVSRVPVFSFACLPDKSAAEYLYDYLKNEGAL